ncbi:ribokinase [Coraliomargarita parva]|uniref:ribokinase n=1 Tax=Coraliomargarita parva TaxID=3014050 RepID=UPI0022B57192|nr:ribokinase [Coraliomargarita parva]
MRTPILNLGSLNIDHVYKVPHFVRPGETLSAESYVCNPGGKGLNQSIAAARAGAKVIHAGAIGQDGVFLKDILLDAGVDTTRIVTRNVATGHALIQVNADSENAIVLHGGANLALTPGDADAALADLPPGTIALTQNETNLTVEFLHKAKRRGLTIAWNPAPINDTCENVPRDILDILIVNQVEGQALSGESEPDAIVRSLSEGMKPGATVTLTLGKQGSLTMSMGRMLRTPAFPVPHAVDTTAAGDTFIGYLLAGLSQQTPLAEALVQASAASALCVQKAGAASSIPLAAETRALRNSDRSGN